MREKITDTELKKLTEEFCGYLSKAFNKFVTDRNLSGEDCRAIAYSVAEDSMLRCAETDLHHPNLGKEACLQGLRWFAQVIADAAKEVPNHRCEKMP